MRNSLIARVKPVVVEKHGRPVLDRSLTLHPLSDGAARESIDGGHYVGVKTVEEFIDWTKQREGGLFVYRGIPNVTWEVESSAYRRIRQSQKMAPPLSVLQSYIERLLRNVRARRFQEYEGLTNLQLLAELQHYGAATCLIDFTGNALIALWFACRDEGRQIPGKVVAMADAPGRFSPEDPNDFPADSVAFLSENKLWKWKPIHPSIRIVTQQSVFVFGPGKIDEKDYESIEIDGGDKEKIREELARRFDIVEQHLFRDFTGFAASHAHDSPYRDYTADDYFSLGFTAQQQGVDEEAKEFYGRVLDLNPQHHDARQNLETVKKRLARARAKADKDTAKQFLTVAEAVAKALQPSKEFAAALKALQISSKSLTAVAKALQPSKEFATALKALQTPSKEFATALKALQTPNKEFATALKALQAPNKEST